MLAGYVMSTGLVFDEAVLKLTGLFHFELFFLKVGMAPFFLQLSYAFKKAQNPYFNFQQLLFEFIDYFNFSSFNSRLNFNFAIVLSAKCYV